jgi:hypothetical protein
MSKCKRIPISLYSTRRQLIIAGQALLLLWICSLPVQAQVLYVLQVARALRRSAS